MPHLNPCAKMTSATPKLDVNNNPKMAALVDKAIRQGNLPFLKWAHSRGFAFDPTDCGIAARSHQLEVLKWMRETEARTPGGEGLFTPSLAASDVLQPHWFSSVHKCTTKTLQDPATGAKIMHWLHGDHTVPKHLRFVPHQHYDNHVLWAHQKFMREQQRMMMMQQQSGVVQPPVATFVPLRARL